MEAAMPHRSDDEIDRLAELACRMIRASDWGVTSTEWNAVLVGTLDPARLLKPAGAALSRSNPTDASTAADGLAEAMRVLPQFVEEVRFPRWDDGYGSADHYRDECEDLVANRFDQALLARTRKAQLRELAERMDCLEGKDEDAAGDLAVALAWVAVDLDPGVVDRVGG
jgi:hypothetical protein